MTQDIAWNEAWKTAGGFMEVSTDWTERYLGKLRVIDIREPNELRGPLGHIADIEFIPMGDLAAEARQWDREEPVVLLCRSGGRSGRMAMVLERMGFQTVVSMAGGMIQWNEEGRDTAPRG
jgi:rhodanese-related sulfurtransferase